MADEARDKWLENLLAENKARRDEFDWMHGPAIRPSLPHSVRRRNFWLKAAMFCLAAMMLGAAVASLL